MNDYIVVIGAANIDIGGTPYNDLIRSDSNPGHINISYGGVGRNVAENLSKLGVDVKFVGAVGDDSLGKDLVNYCRSCGIDTDNMLTVEGCSSSMYIYINNKEGDMAIALSDVDIADRITPSYLDSIADVINNAKAVMMDCNVSRETYLHLMDICKVPVIIDPVSQPHASKIKDHLEKIDILKPNRLEAEYLTDTVIKTSDDYVRAARILMDKGVKKVFISMGSGGIYAADRNICFFADRYPVSKVASTTGAGDTATAAIIWSMISDQDENPIIHAAKSANTAASLTVESLKTINPEMSPESVNKRINENKIKIYIL